MHDLCDFAMFCLNFHTLLIIFGLITQCTQLPVPVFCCFCISGFPAIKSAPKIPENYIKNQRPGSFQNHQGREGGTTGTLEGSLARPHPGPRHAPSWLPCGPPD